MHISLRQASALMAVVDVMEKAYQLVSDSTGFGELAHVQTGCVLEKYLYLPAVAAREE